MGKEKSSLLSIYFTFLARVAMEWADGILKQPLSEIPQCTVERDGQGEG